MRCFKNKHITLNGQKITVDYFIFEKSNVVSFCFLFTFINNYFITLFIII